MSRARPRGKRSGSSYLSGFRSILDGMASIGQGMADIMGAVFDPVPSRRTRRLLEERDLPDGERLRRDARRICGWSGMEPWAGPPSARRVWPQEETRDPEMKS